MAKNRQREKACNRLSLTIARLTGDGVIYGADSRGIRLVIQRRISGARRLSFRHILPIRIVAARATRITAVSLLSGGMLAAIRQNERSSGDRPRDARQQSNASHRV
jgi:hypothetical protein